MHEDERILKQELQEAKHFGLKLKHMMILQKQKLAELKSMEDRLQNSISAMKDEIKTMDTLESKITKVELINTHLRRKNAYLRSNRKNSAIIIMILYFSIALK